MPEHFQSISLRLKAARPEVRKLKAKYQLNTLSVSKIVHLQRVKKKVQVSFHFFDNYIELLFRFTQKTIL